MSSERRLILTVGMPIAGIILGFNEWVIPSFIRHFFFDYVFMFGVTYWLGLIFSNMYFYMVEDLKQEGASPTIIAIMAGGLAIAMLIAAGGPIGILETPWLIGGGVMPGVDIAWPVAKEWWTKKQAAAATNAAASAEASPSVARDLTQESLVEPSAEEPA